MVISQCGGTAGELSRTPTYKQDNTTSAAVVTVLLHVFSWKNIFYGLPYQYIISISLRRDDYSKVAVAKGLCEQLSSSCT